jgi:hypothetical protein
MIALAADATPGESPNGREQSDGSSDGCASAAADRRVT